ncbi:hypothetical protein [Kingella potus]|uniref:hypothetical protein n=1 Tax=Kingella potus TaxID=265175 RepID=UPI0011C06AC7|nr:hypothetical protein [Kingella potus]
MAPIQTYDDVEAYFNAHMIYEDGADNNPFAEITAGRLNLRLVIAYLRGQKDLAGLKEKWLHQSHIRFVNKEKVEVLLAKALVYLENRPLDR